MESERRERRGRITDSNDAAENTCAGNSEPVTGNSKYSGQVVWILYRIVDSGTDRILDLSLHTGKPGQSDPAFHLPGGVHGNPGPASSHKPSHLEA